MEEIKIENELEAYRYLREKYDDYKKTIYEFFISSTRKIKGGQTFMHDIFDLYEVWAIKNKKARIDYDIFMTLFPELINEDRDLKSNEYHGYNKKICKNWAMHKGSLINKKKQ